jgi:hypothetical protein
MEDAETKAWFVGRNYLVATLLRLNSISILLPNLPEMKIALIAFFLLSTLVVNSQETTDVTDVMAKETCDCVSQKTNGVIGDGGKVSEELGICLVNSYFKHEAEASKQFGITEFNEQAGEIIGQKVGVKMLKHCPELIMKIGAASGDEEPAEEEESENIDIKGKIQSVEEGEFIAFKLKDASNTVHRIVWLTKFEGSEQFEKNPKALVGKTVTVTVYELDFFIAKTKTYAPVKQILALTIE